MYKGLNNNSIDKIIIYLRVSTDEQRDFGHSIEEQLHTLQKMVNINHNLERCNLTILNDAGFSANNFKRPEYLKLKKLISENKVDFLYVMKLDRLNRNLIEGLNFLTEATEKGVTIVLPTETIDLKQPEKELSVIIRLIFAYYESRMASSRTKSGMAGGLKKGLYSLGGALPYGFTRTLENKIEKNPDEEPIVNEIIDDYINTPLSINQLSTKYDIAYKTITNILTSDIYRGTVSYEDEEYVIDELPYIDSETDKVIQVKKNIFSKQNKYIYLFKNKLYCAKCSSSLKAKSTVKKNAIYLYYRCENSSCIDYKKQINEIKVSNLLNPFTDKCLIYNSKFKKETDNTIVEQIEKIQKKITTLENLKKQLLNKFLDFKIDEETYNSRKKDINYKINIELKNINRMTANMNYNKYLKSKIYDLHLSDFLVDITKETVKEYTKNLKIENDIK